MIMLVRLVNVASRPCRNTTGNCTSIPATKSRSTTDNLKIASSETATEPVCGNKEVVNSGKNLPNNVGPSRIPTIISPISIGKPTFFPNSAKTREAINNKLIDNNNTMNSVLVN